MTKVRKVKRQYPEKVIATQDFQSGDSFEIKFIKYGKGKKKGKFGGAKEAFKDVKEWHIKPSKQIKADGFVREDAKKGEELNEVYIFQ